MLETSCKDVCLQHKGMPKSIAIFGRCKICLGEVQRLLTYSRNLFCN